MYVMYGHADLLLPYCSSLKEKRKIVNSIVSRIRSRFNVSVSEAYYHDLWQRSILGFSAISHSNSDLEFIINAIKDTLYSSNTDSEVVNFDYEIIVKKFID